MSKPFNIHDWQAKRIQQRLNENLKEMNPNQDPKSILSKQIVNIFNGRLGNWYSEKVTSMRDVENLFKRDREQLEKLVYDQLREHDELGDGGNLGEHHDDKDFPGKNLSAWDLLDKIKSSDPKLYDRVESFMKSMNEMNTLGSAGAGASFTAGDGEAYATPNAFKKKKKK